jgi:hypothetical protein
MKNAVKLGLFFLGLGSGVSSAQALELTLVGGYNYAAPTEKVTGTGDLQWTGDAATAYGAFLSTSFIVPLFDLESGLLFQNQKSERSINGNTLFETSKSIQLPILLRVNFDNFIGVGVGYYFNYGQGNIDTDMNGTTTSLSYSDSNRKSLDSGLLFDLRVKYPLAPALAIVFDGRYQHGLTNLETGSTQAAGDSYYARMLQVLLGLSFKI